MSQGKYAKYAELSPFELKDKLIEIATSDSARMMLNAGRGNPNFLDVLARRAFLRLGDFAVQEAERSYAYLGGSFGGLPEREGIVGRFDAYAYHFIDTPGVSFLHSAITYVGDRLGLNRESFLYEAVGAFLGCNYPVPPRMLRHAEQIVKAYLAQEMYGPVPRAGDFSLFATEGGTAAMTYIFQTLRENRLIAPGDKIALGTPIFSPYLEIPPLADYGLEIVDIRMDEQAGWQYPAAELKKLEDPKIKIFCVVNPANPPSVKMSTSGLEQVSRIIEKKRPDLFVVTDDVYGTFADDFVSLFATCPRNTLCVYSFSKYFGATGWRLGVIALHEDNAFDEALAAEADGVKRDLEKRYSSLTTDVAGLRFIDRLVADSRTVALNHTAGLSVPQQLQMTLFALHGLMDRESRYKNAAKELIRSRHRTLWANIGVPVEHGHNDVDYYTLIDLRKLSERIYGKDFAAWFRDGNKATDFLFRLAEETGVVLLPGRGFEVVEPSARVSLANLTEADYIAIGKFTRRIIDEYYGDYQKESG